LRERVPNGSDRVGSPSSSPHSGRRAGANLRIANRGPPPTRAHAGRAPPPPRRPCRTWDSGGEHGLASRAPVALRPVRLGVETSVVRPRRMANAPASRFLCKRWPATGSTLSRLAHATADAFAMWGEDKAALAGAARTGRGAWDPDGVPCPRPTTHRGPKRGKSWVFGGEAPCPRCPRTRRPHRPVGAPRRCVARFDCLQRELLPRGRPPHDRECCAGRCKHLARGRGEANWPDCARDATSRRPKAESRGCDGPPEPRCSTTQIRDLKDEIRLRTLGKPRPRTRLRGAPIVTLERRRTRRGRPAAGRAAVVKSSEHAADTLRGPVCSRRPMPLATDF